MEVFQHDMYLGYKKEFTRSSYVEVSWKISSMKAIKGNWELYDNFNYQGFTSMIICEGEELSGLSDRVLSVKYTEICGKNF